MVVEIVKCQIRLQRRQRCPFEERREIADRGELAQNEVLPRPQFSGLEEGLPGESSGIGLELRLGTRVVGCLHVAAFFDGPLRLRHIGFESHDGGGFGVRRLNVAECQQLLDVGDILLTHFLELRVLLQVVVAVRQPEAGLADDDAVAVRILQIRRDIDVVERSESRRAEDCSDRLFGGHAGDALQIGGDRREAIGFDGRLIHETCIVVADLLLRGAGRGMSGGGGLDDLAHAALGQIRELVERPVGGAVGRKLETVEPFAVGIDVEVVSRPNVGLHGGQIEAELADSRPRARRSRRCW